jgi:diadenosine tetraphosphate (Ap4A) HIT family hydrolase
MTRRMAPTTKGPRGQDETIWQPLVDGSACPICRQGEPLDIVADLPASWATASRHAPVRWYVCVTAKQHVIEPFELREPARSQFWNDVLLVAEALQRASGAVKVNYEIHGNSIPHLHCHVYPIVSEGDTRTVEADRDNVERSAQQIQAITTAIQVARNSAAGARLDAPGWEDG